MVPPPQKKIMMYLRIELTNGTNGTRVHLLYVECYVCFVTFIPHSDFVRKIELPAFHRGWDWRLGGVRSLALDLTANQQAAQDKLSVESGCPDPHVCSLSITPACHGGEFGKGKLELWENLPWISPFCQGLAWKGTLNTAHKNVS